MYTLGIDFGKKGGFALLKEQVIIQKWVMPLTEDNEIDPQGVLDIARESTERVLSELSHRELVKLDGMPIKIYGEVLHALFNSSAKSTFNFGKAYGVVIGVIEANLGPINLIRAVDWQKQVFTQLEIAEVKKTNSNRRDTKLMALHSALHLWPDESWVESPRHRRLHDGMIDAALIAYYGGQNE